MNGSFFRVLILGVLSVVGLLSACSGSDPRCANLPGGGRYCLQATSVVSPFDLQQKVEATINGVRETMIAEIEVDAEGMRFVGVTPFGQKLVQTSYDNREAKTTLMMNTPLEPALLLGFLQMALWPAESVRAGLEGFTLEEGYGQRLVKAGDDVVVQVSYTAGRLPRSDMHVVLPFAHIELEITTLDVNGTK